MATGEQAAEAPAGRAPSPTAGAEGSPWPFLEPDDSFDQDAIQRINNYLNFGFSRKVELFRQIQSKCSIDPSWSGCWVWKGPHSGEGRGGGYGRFSFKGVTASVHRTMYQLCYGPIPPRKQIDHTCKNRLCCNPVHLVCVTHKKNQKLRDARNKP